MNLVETWLRLATDWNALADGALRRHPGEQPLFELACFILLAPPVHGGEKTEPSRT